MTSPAHSSPRLKLLALAVGAGGIGAALAVGTMEYQWGALLMLPLLVITALYRPLWVFYFLALSAPFTIEKALPGLGVALALPTEPFLLVAAALFGLHLALTRQYPSEILHHPITWAVLAYLVWMGLTTLTSTLFFVSLKHWIKHAVYVVVLYFMGLRFFRRFDYLRNFLLLYIWGLTVVSLYTLYVEAQGFFTHEVAYFASAPFYADHTIYGAVLGVMFPPAVVLASFPDRFRLGRLAWGLTAFSAVVLGVSIITSYSRATWLSMMGVMVFALFLMLRVRLRTILALTAAVVALVVINWEQIYVFMATNRAASATDFRKHLQSIYNIATDPSNMERINRWSCALRMAQDKPLVGFGPATYAFQYGPYQLSYQRTEISTNFGDIGGAHQEYLTALSEMGVPGFLIYTLLVLLIIRRGMHVYYDRRRPSPVRWLALGVLLGLASYHIHGFINNFLETDEMPFVWWATVAILVALDVYGKPEAPSSSAAEKSHSKI